MESLKWKSGTLAFSVQSQCGHTRINIIQLTSELGQKNKCNYPSEMLNSKSTHTRAALNTCWLLFSHWMKLGSLPTLQPRHSCLCLNRIIQGAWVIQDWKRRQVPTSYSSPTKFLAITDLKPWLLQRERETSCRVSLISDKIPFNGGYITKSPMIHRNRSRCNK